ncbi:NAD(P)-dependent malic enzyme [Halarsenatibacter silvermanii]|uniref:Malate dehydrogenase (Oxaloacetate-decarboxylating) n=1 Tax=Halarsenatibacter silvermanii TaxID=321763 RepID=A0A1G9RJK3_9FIRM|nr:NADP-dependent malic enzyme [Halarsenatibacter silvermanii]SDM23077.1 malate dehydrogenase (oxaloacetate-decarboxylating) [Halarsenatibacter silvermanii]
MSADKNNQNKEKKMTEEELLAQAEEPAEKALEMHPFYQGKLEVSLKAPVRNYDDFAIWYTPGVAASCRKIAENTEEVYRQTNRGNMVAVVTNGTRVLGLGDIGPEAALPVMEGKSLLFKYLGGVDAYPICLDIRDTEEFVSTVKALQPSLGGINLEDISNPECFRILERLREECDIPVFHDDQQGTACVTIAGLINAFRYVDKDIRQAQIALIGAGAANVATLRLLTAYGVPAGNIIMSDSSGILHEGRLDNIEEKYREKRRICRETNAENITGDIPDALAGSDAVVALAAPGPDLIQPEWIQNMAEDPIIFACANPIPEIWPWEARKAGAAVVATGRSDFANQVNNSLGFPAIFRGVLDVHADSISDEMCIAAAEELADFAAEDGVDPDKILPTMEEKEVYYRVAAATAEQAIKEGRARREKTREEVYESARQKIERAQKQTQTLMDAKVIPEFEQ